MEIGEKKLVLPNLSLQYAYTDPGVKDKIPFYGCYNSADDIFEEIEYTSNKFGVRDDLGNPIFSDEMLSMQNYALEYD